VRTIRTRLAVIPMLVMGGLPAYSGGALAQPPPNDTVSKTTTARAGGKLTVRSYREIGRRNHD
jgi:hypothetical protein